MKKMIFMCISFCVMAVIARVYMAGGIDGILGSGSGGFSLKTPKDVKTVTTDRDVQVYKWRDKNGVVHFGEVPPDSDIATETIQLKANQNVLNATAVNRESEAKSAENERVDMANPYSPEGIGQMISQTKALTESLNMQQAEKDRMMEGMNQR